MDTERSIDLGILYRFSPLLYPYWIMKPFIKKIFWKLWNLEYEQQAK